MPGEVLSTGTIDKRNLFNSSWGQSPDARLIRELGLAFVDDSRRVEKRVSGGRIRDRQSALAFLQQPRGECGHRIG